VRVLVLSMAAARMREPPSVFLQKTHNVANFHLASVCRLDDAQIGQVLSRRVGERGLSTTARAHHTA